LNNDLRSGVRTGAHFLITGYISLYLNLNKKDAQKQRKEIFTLYTFFNGYRITDSDTVTIVFSSIVPVGILV